MKHLKYYVILLLFSQNIFSQKNTIVKLNSVEIVLPGKWKYLGSNKISGQHTFENEKTKVGLFISAREKTKLEFFNDSLSDFGLVNAFYKWDSQYWKNSETIIALIKEDENNKYIIWHLKTKNVDNFILNGIYGNHLIGINISDDLSKKKLQDNEKIEILEQVYLK